MKVRMKVGISGARGGQPWPQVGEILETSDDEAAHLCQAGLAEPVVEDPGPKVETATAPAAEKRSPPAKRSK